MLAGKFNRKHLISCAVKLTISNIIGTDPACHQEAKDSGCNRHPKELLAAVDSNLLQETSRLGGKGHHLIIHDALSRIMA
jgi:hypothetical protein